MLVGKGNHAQFTSLSNPWIVGTPLLHIRDTFCTPNCMQTILDNPDLADSNLIFSVRTSTGAAGANNLTLDTRIALLLILLTSDYFITGYVMADWSLLDTPVGPIQKYSCTGPIVSVQLTMFVAA